MSDSSNPTIPTPAWSWGNFPSSSGDATPRATSSESPSSFEAGDAHAENAPAEEAPHRPEKHYKSRTCRICFEDVQPTFDFPSAPTQFLGGKPRVRYVSEDMGRLMRPCKCKGSQKYVHEGCLRAWRTAAPSNRNLWHCPTCKYAYRLERLTWGKWASSKVLRAALTALILVSAIFLLGFIADPIINLWSDPLGMFIETLTGPLDEFEELRDWLPQEEPNTWSWHFYKGFMSLGLVGLVKSFIAMTPWHFWNIRIGGGARRGGRGRDRLENISWTLVLIGVVTFLGVSAPLLAT